MSTPPITAGPYLHLVAVWLAEDRTEELAAVVRGTGYPAPAGYPRGYTVSFRREVADSPSFRRVLERLDLAELNARPAAIAL